MKIGFTGTRMGMSENQILKLIMTLIDLNPTEAHHGLCIGGDSEFHDRVRASFPKCKIIGHPPKNLAYAKERDCDERREPKDYIERNHDIVDEVDVMIACPLGSESEERRSGTWATIRYANKVGRTIIILAR